MVARQLTAATHFPEQFPARQTGTGEQCSPLQEFFDSLRGCFTSPKKKDRSCKAFFGFYFGLSFLEDVQQPIFCIYFADAQDFRTSIRRSTLSSIAFIRVASMNSDARLSEKAASMISLTPLSLSKSIHPKSVTSPSCSI